MSLNLTPLQQHHIHELVCMTLPIIDDAVERCRESGIRIRTWKVDAPRFIPRGHHLCTVGTSEIMIEVYAK